MVYGLRLLLLVECASDLPGILQLGRSAHTMRMEDLQTIQAKQGPPHPEGPTLRNRPSIAVLTRFTDDFAEALMTSTTRLTVVDGDQVAGSSVGGNKPIKVWHDTRTHRSVVKIPVGFDSG
ncbi:hypothetical protein BDW22DRAFT_1418913 [Trametopsis cervina]|nr:hypothetical protein BDW22DRAFT_1418913 [Trametopsis cervina]